MSKSFQTVKQIGVRVAVFLMAILNNDSLYAQGTKPNIVFIYMDDLGWTDVAAGSKYYETPRIDALAKESLVFSQAYSVGPNCAPSRASLMTGKYTPRHGVFTVGTSERGDSTKRKLIPVQSNPVLNPAFVTIAEALRDGGYQTALIGKWQLGGKKVGADARAQGFDYVIGGTPGTPSYFYPYTGKNEQSNHEGITGGKDGEYLTDRLTDEALKYVGEHKEKPFFLYLSYFAVHTPIQGKPGKVAKFKAKKGDEFHNNPTYAAMLESADEGVGRVLDELKKLNLEQNTVVIFYSDNGGYGGATAQPPLRGSKGMLYEGGVRVPLFVRWPGKVKPGTKTNAQVIGVDFYPTLLQVAGVQKPPNNELDGQSFLPVLLGQPFVERDAIYWHFPAYLEGYNADKRHKDIFRTRPVSAIRSGDYKLLEFYEDHHVELYNIKDDIGETTDLAAKLPAQRSALFDKLQQWKKTVNAPVPTTPNPLYKP